MPSRSPHWADFFYVNIEATPVGLTNLPAGFIECASSSSFCLNASISAACFVFNVAASRAFLRFDPGRLARAFEFKRFAIRTPPIVEALEGFFDGAVHRCFRHERSRTV